MRYVFFLGSNSSLSKAELFTTLNRDNVKYQIEIKNKRYLAIETTTLLSPALLTHWGGCGRLARIIAISSRMWEAQDLTQIISPSKDTKSAIGFSAINVSTKTIQRLAIALKKTLRAEGVKIKFLLPQKKTTQLNAAQVIFNKLVHEPNQELTFIAHNNSWLLAKTEQIQDIQSYEMRDTRRPSRDARVGMLPPKLAQIMLNLIPRFDKQPPLIYDPYCGTGTILQEGLLMGYHMIGSDLNPSMIDASRNNLSWLKQKFTLPASPATEEVKLFTHDTNQPFPAWLKLSIDAIITEPYLGKPLTMPLPPRAAQAQIDQLGRQYLLFFKHAQKVLKDNSYLVFIFPAFRQPGKAAEFVTFPKKIFDEITSFGYCLKHLPAEQEGRPSDSNIDNRGTILYSRPDAFIAREITLWQKVN